VTSTATAYNVNLTGYGYGKLAVIDVTARPGALWAVKSRDTSREANRVSQQRHLPKALASAAKVLNGGDKPKTGDTAEMSKPLLHSRGALIVGVPLLVLTAVLLPIAIGSIFMELVLTPEAPVYFPTEAPTGSQTGAGSPRATANYLNIAVVAIDEAKDLATLRISGNRTCAGDCPSLQLVLSSLSDGLARRAGLPPSATVVLPVDAQPISTSVELPVGGQLSCSG
jgi:hypothetical protein